MTAEHERVLERALQRRVVEHAAASGRVNQRSEKPCQRRARAAVVEREQDRDQRPGTIDQSDVDGRDERRGSAAGPRDCAASSCTSRALVARPAGRAQVVEHQHEQERPRAAASAPRRSIFSRALARELVDLVADHVRLRRGRDQVGACSSRRTSAARSARAPARMPGIESGSVTRRNALERARAEVARRLDVALVDAVERRVERQDQERDVAVDERDDHRRSAGRRASRRCSASSPS